MICTIPEKDMRAAGIYRGQLWAASWGFRGETSGFYEVARVTARKVWIQAVESHPVEFWDGQIDIVPDTSRKIGVPLERKMYRDLSGNCYIRIAAGCYAYAYNRATDSEPVQE
jgi:hypothetical protein